MSGLREAIKESMNNPDGTTKELVERALQEQMVMPTDGAPIGWDDFGVHAHRLRDLKEGKWIASEDGSGHKHMVKIGGRMYWTEAGGEHSHEGNSADQEAVEENEHTHLLIVSGELYESGPGSPHGHEMLVYATCCDGAHTHEFEVDGETVVTADPASHRAEITSESES